MSSAPKTLPDDVESLKALVRSQAEQLEEIAGGLARGIEPEINIAVDEVFPPEYLANALHDLSLKYPNTRVQLMETILTGGPEKLTGGEVELLVIVGGNPVYDAPADLDFAGALNNVATRRQR